MDVPSMVSVPSESTLVGKTFASRAGAYIVDIIIMNVMSFTISFIAGLVLGLVAFAAGIDTNVEEPSFLENLLLGIPVTVAYFVSFEGLFAATPAKLLFGMRVVKLDGSPVGFGGALVRGLFR